MKLSADRGRPMTRALPIDNLKAILAAALRSNEPPAVLAALQVLLPCDAWSLASADIANIDRDAGILQVSDPRGNPVEVALGYAAAMVIEIAANGRASGPLVDDGHWQAVVPDRCTEEYARELLLDGNGKPLPFRWTYRSLQEAVFDDMADGGIPHHVVMAQAGLGMGHVVGIERELLLRDQRAAADWWSYRLGLDAPSPFEIGHRHLVRSFGIGGLLS